MRHPGNTPPFRGSDGEVLPASIAEVAYLRLGGVDQWVMVRGESVANPPLILLQQPREVRAVHSTPCRAHSGMHGTGVLAVGRLHTACC